MPSRRSACQKSFDKLVDGGASSPARCRVSNLRFEPSAVSPSAKPENPLGFQPSCHPYQFLLKSFRFPGAKTARKRFLLWKMGFSAAKILPCPPYMPLGTIEIREGFGPLELSEGFSTVCRDGSFALPSLFSWADSVFLFLQVVVHLLEIGRAHV